MPRISYAFCTSAALLAAALATTPVAAATAGGLSLGVSYISYEVDKTAQAASGKTGFMGTPFYNLAIQYNFGITQNLLISPVVSYFPESVYGHTTPEKGAKTSLMTVGLPVIVNLGTVVDLSAGPTLMRYTVTGKGGSIELDNGNGVAKFGLPARTVTTNTLALQTGAAVNIGSWRGGLDILTAGLLSSTRRTFSLVLSLGGNIHVFK